MSRVVVGVVVGSILVGQAGLVRAEEPATSAPFPAAAPVTTPAPAVTVPAPCPPAADAVAEKRAFEREMDLFARRWEFTRRLIAEREARAFEEAEARYTRFAALTRQLAENAAAEAEREFDSSVALFVKKRDLTRALSAQPKAAAPAADTQRSR